MNEFIIPAAPTAPIAQHKELINKYLGKYIELPQEAEKKYKSAYITPETEIEEPQSLLYLGGQRVFSRGDISVIIGAQKGRKTLFATSIAHYLLRYDIESPVNSDVNNPTILFIDTEQSEYHAVNTYKRITAGLTAEQTNKLHFLTLRQFSSLERVQATAEAIEEIRPDLVIIDGISDLCPDTLNAEYCAAFVEWYAALASTYNCHITSVLHTSSANGNKARGHLGSELERKCESVIKVDKRSEDNGASSRVTAHYTRNKPFTALTIAHDENQPHGFSLTPEVIETTSDKRNKIIARAADLAGTQTEIVSSGIDRKTLIDYISIAYKERSGKDCQDRTADTIIKYALDNEIITKSGSTNKTRYYFSSETPPNEPPAAQTEQLQPITPQIKERATDGGK